MFDNTPISPTAASFESARLARTGHDLYDHEHLLHLKQMEIVS